jgi:hypothetical protein
MRAWYIPAWNGDWRIEPDKDDKASVLTIEKPTASERAMLKKLATAFLSKRWIDDGRAEKMRDPSGWRKTSVVLDASLVEVGPHVASIIKPGQNVITAVRFKDGRIEVSETSRVATEEEEAAESSGHPYRPEPKKDEPVAAAPAATAASAPPPQPKAADKPTEESKALAKKEGAEAAATVKRATPCCPSCYRSEEVNKPATEVLLSFLDEEQHAEWAAHRFFRFRGGMSDHEYLVAHRNSAIAERNSRVAYDLDDDAVLHCHDWLVPPEEEVLGIYLILRFREHWLRNEATTFFPTDVRFKNPFGDGMDGVRDSWFTANVGKFLLEVLEPSAFPSLPKTTVFNPQTGAMELIDTAAII